MITVFIRAGGLLGLIPALLGVLCLVAASSMADTADRLGRDGVTTEATIVERRTEPRQRPGTTTTTVASERTYQAPVLTVTFTDGAGTEHRVKRDVSGALYDRTQGAATVPITYLPDDPSVYRLEHTNKGEQVWIAIAVGAAFLGFGLVMMLGKLRTARTAQTLAENGTPAPATVMHIRRSWPFSQIVYQFKDEKDRWRGGTSFWRLTGNHRTLEPNDYLTVFYDPANPKKSYWKNDLRQDH